MLINYRNATMPTQNKSMNETDAKGHSEECFGDFRDFWYNRDFLELMAKRWELTSVKLLLYVGCGQCH